MHDTDHPAIKLFGKEIPLPPPSAGALSGVSDDEVASSPAMNPNNREEEDEVEKESTKLQAWGETAKPKTPSVDEETAKSKASSTDQERTESCDSQEKPLKKPDKILPCPRCNSKNTKFCYYNNYNVNQPRYFCKSCQRYWTAGGTMRNVPVGAGRRKNKSSNSHYRHITISEEVLQAAYAVDAPNGTHLPDEKDNGTVLNFGVDIPVCDSMASILNRMGRNRNGIHGLRRNMVSNSCRSSGNCDDCSSESTVSISGSADEGNGNYCPEQPMDSVNECSPPQLLGLAGVPWPCYQWNPAFLSQPLCPSGIAMPIYPTTFWNCGLHTTFDVPLSSPSYQKTTNSSGPDLPTLGKHPREDEVQGQDDPVKDECSKQRSDNCVLAPKTLRIGDPTEAAKSTIWTTLGIKNDQLCKERLYKGLSKCEEKNHVPAVPVLCANPAALSRSLHFRESY